MGDNFLSICDWYEEPGELNDFFDFDWEKLRDFGAFRSSNKVLESQVEPLRLLEPDLVMVPTSPICLRYSLSSNLLVPTSWLVLHVLQGSHTAAYLELNSFIMNLNLATSGPVLNVIGRPHL